MKLECVPHEISSYHFLLLIDEEPIKSIHRDIFGKFPKLKYEAKDRSALLDWFKEKEFSCSKHYALKRLSKKSYSSFELAKILREKNVSHETIIAVIEKCQSLHLIDDNDWLRCYITQAVKKKLGPRAIAQKLKAKGIPADQFEELLFNNACKEAQMKSMHFFLERKYADLKTDFKMRSRAQAFLIRKGFDFENIQEAISRFMKER